MIFPDIYSIPMKELISCYNICHEYKVILKFKLNTKQIPNTLMLDIKNVTVLFFDFSKKTYCNLIDHELQ